MGYMRLEVGKNLLGIEGEVAFAVPGSFTVHNFPCSENGANCNKGGSVVGTQHYVDPSNNLEALHARIAQDQEQALLKKQLKDQSTKRALRS